MKRVTSLTCFGQLWMERGIIIYHYWEVRERLVLRVCGWDSITVQNTSSTAGKIVNKHILIKPCINYSSFLPDPSNYDFCPRLFHMSSATGQFTSTEILCPSRYPGRTCPFPVLQDDLYSASQPGNQYDYWYYWYNWGKNNLTKDEYFAVFQQCLFMMSEMRCTFGKAGCRPRSRRIKEDLPNDVGMKKGNSPYRRHCLTLKVCCTYRSNSGAILFNWVDLIDVVFYWLLCFLREVLAWFHQLYSSHDALCRLSVAHKILMSVRKSLQAIVWRIKMMKTRLQKAKRNIWIAIAIIGILQYFILLILEANGRIRKGFVVQAGLEPSSFTTRFPFWNRSQAIAEIQRKEGKCNFERKSVEEALDTFSKCVSFYHFLLNRNFVFEFVLWSVPSILESFQPLYLSL